MITITMDERDPDKTSFVLVADPPLPQLTVNSSQEECHRQCWIGNVLQVKGIEISKAAHEICKEQSQLRLGEGEL
jgi:hypothetical protein